MTRLIAAALFFGSWLAGASPVFAHVPHDDVGDIELSPRFSSDGTMYATVRGVLFKSTTEGYSWKRLFDGLGTCTHWLVEIAMASNYPADPTMFITCDEGGLYRSLDGGETWEQRDAGIGDEEIVQVVMSPRYGTDRSVLAIGSGGTLYRTRNGGETWERTLEEVDASAIVWNPGRLVVGTTSGALYRSEDGGGSWSTLGRLPDGSRITYLDVSLHNSPAPELYVGTAREGGFWSVALDGPFRPALRSTLGAEMTSITSFYQDGRQILVATAWDESVFRSEDFGVTWRQYGRRLMKSEQADELGFPHFSTIVAAEQSPTLFLASFCGIFRSNDGGRTWFRLEVSLYHIVGLDVALSPEEQISVVLSTYATGAYASHQEEAWHVLNEGLASPRLGAIAYSPAYDRDRTLFAANYSRVLRSTDGGTTWSSTTLLRPDEGVEKLKTIVRRLLSRSETLRQKSWFEALGRDDDGFSEVLVFALSPDFIEDQTVFAGTHPGGVWRSQDGGQSFSLLWDGGSDVRSLSVSPNFSQDRTLFAALEDGRLFRSHDGGLEWERIGTDLPLGTAGEAVVAVSPHYGVDRTLYAGGKGGLFRSRDGGASWVRVGKDRIGRNGPVTGLAVSPDYRTDRQLLVQVKGGQLWLCYDREDRFEAVRSTASENGYGFFQLITRESAPLIKFSPNYGTDRTVYAASVNHFVTSTDGGQSWTPVPRPDVRFEVETSFTSWFFLPVYLDGAWNREIRADHSSSQAIYATEPESKVTMTFVGTGITWVGNRGPDRGIARVYIDGVEETTVDQFSDGLEYAAPLYSIDGLAYGPHAITVQVDSSRNPEATGHRVDVDAFDVSMQVEEALKGGAEAPNSSGSISDAQQQTIQTL